MDEFEKVVSFLASAPRKAADVAKAAGIEEELARSYLRTLFHQGRVEIVFGRGYKALEGA